MDVLNSNMITRTSLAVCLSTVSKAASDCAAAGLSQMHQNGPAATLSDMLSLIPDINNSMC